MTMPPRDVSLKKFRGKICISYKLLDAEYSIRFCALCSVSSLQTFIDLPSSFFVHASILLFTSPPKVNHYNFWSDLLAYRKGSSTQSNALIFCGTCRISWSQLFCSSCHLGNTSLVFLFLVQISISFTKMSVDDKIELTRCCCWISQGL